ncbi:MAG: mechanosensitive ion channel family protein [Haloarculaceae archaeon]
MVVDQLLSETYFGSTISQYLLFFAILSVGAVLGRSLGFLYNRHLEKKAEATKTEIDDIILYALGKPIILLGAVGAAAVGQVVLTPVEPITSAIDVAIEILVIVLIAWTAVRLTDGLTKTYIGEYAEQTETKLDDALIPVVSRMTNIAIVSIAGIVILDSVGYNVNAIIASFGIGSVAVAFASRKALTDIFGGVHIFSAKPFLVDDLVEIDGTAGRVEEIGLRTTKIRDFDGRLITFPNSQIADTEVKNITTEPTRRVETFIELSYETSPAEMVDAINLAEESVNAVDGVDPEQTGAWFWEYGDWGMRIRLIYHIENLDDWKGIIHHVNQNIQERFEDAGLEMAVRNRDIHVDGEIGD